MHATVLGGGSWGTALADLLGNTGASVTIWTIEEDVAHQIESKHENSRYLPGAALSERIRATTDIEAALLGAEVILVVVPTPAIRPVMSKALPYLSDGVPLITASKGIENESLMTCAEILEDVLPEKLHPYLAYVSGPSFAREVAQKQPTAVTVAAYWPRVAARAQHLLSAPYFRVYTSTDVMGVEIGGALKNVIAIGAGIIDGLGLGHNTRAALITRGLAELTRLGLAKGAHAQTFMGLSGMGDLILTCTGGLSRNRTVGFELGKGRRLDEILGELGTVAEGVKTTKSAHDLGIKLGVELPITDAVHGILYENKPAPEAVLELMARKSKPEIY